MPHASPLERALAERLGLTLRTLREERGLTQEVVAQRSDISRQHLQLLEAGIARRQSREPSNPRIGTLVALAGTLGVPVAQLVDDVFGRQAG
ncbi:helix-turn-helix transcriptional regulator [Pseudokineococcus basanitobsidens]|uniref:Helix-turn-helix transcriptional regulator n=1 Tax=Pseudokineococcus basanitobsidens TaxID=1926649 RepID=A0ABU8RGU1_9ACTN